MLPRKHKTKGGGEGIKLPSGNADAFMSPEILHEIFATSTNSP